MADNTEHEPTPETQTVASPTNKISGGTIAMIIVTIIFIIAFGFLAASFFSGGYGTESNSGNSSATRANP